MPRRTPRPLRQRGWKAWFRSLFSAPRAAAGLPRRLRMESLERRWVRSSFTVTDNSDNAGDANSLRYAIEHLAAGTAAVSNTITINSTLTGGQTITLGSALDINQGVTITGPGADKVAISGNNATQVFRVESGVEASIADVTITGGNAYEGGGIFNAGTLSITNSIISGNTASSQGGGVYDYLGSVSIANSTISGNTATWWGGGVFDYHGSVSIANSTISGNTANNQGGGVYNGYQGSVSIANSTISGNTADQGGGVYDYGISLSITNSTISGNTANTRGGGVYGGAHGSVALQNSILSGNSAPSDPDLQGTLTDNGNNLLGTALGAGSPPASDIFTDSPGLAPLGNYGGATATRAPLPGSQALGGGSVLGGVIPTVDQRGVNRPTTGSIDIGAYQSEGFTLSLGSGSSPQTALVGSAFTNALALTVTANGLGGAVDGGVITFTVNPGGSSQGATLSAASAAISGGQVSVTATANGQTGAYTVTASPGNTSSPASFDLTNQATTSISASSAGITYQAGGESVTLSATVSSTAGPVNEGTVTFVIKQGATVIGTATTSTTVVAGAASVSYALPSGTAAGAYTIAATYNPGPDFLASSDNTQTLTVNPPVAQIQSSVVAPVFDQPHLFNNSTTDAGISYIKSLYLAILDRPAEGFLPNSQVPEYWLGVLNSLGGVTAPSARQAVATMIWNAPEHRLDEVADYYQTLLQRSAGADPQSMAWVDALEAGVGEFSVVQAIMSSPEYQHRTAGDNSLFVQNLLGALGVGGGATTVTINGASVDLLAGLGGGALSRSQAAGDALLSDQSLQTIVGSMYQAYLQRHVEANLGLLYWSGQMRANGVEYVGVSLLSSDEYLHDIQANLS